MKKLTLIFLALAAIIQNKLPSIELTRVILSTNKNIEYSQFWPVVAPVWEAMGLRPTLALIADDDFIVDESLGDVIRFKPLKDVPESLQAQAIRLLLPALFPDDGCLISDIDMIPVSRTYFFDGAAKCPSGAFLIYRDRAIPNNYPMCYVAAEGAVFSAIFGVSNADEFLPLIKEWAKMGYGWNTDEKVLFQTINNWQKQGYPVVKLGHEIPPRIDRGDWWPMRRQIGNIKGVIDCHCPRPYCINKDSIDRLVKAILDQLEEEG